MDSDINLTLQMVIFVRNDLQSDCRKPIRIFAIESQFMVGQGIDTSGRHFIERRNPVR